MLAIYKRELKSYLHTVIGSIFIAAVLLLIGLYFFAYNLYSCYPYFSYAISSASIVILVAVPILTMRMIAEERKNKTDQLILTAPVKVWAIVLGKFFAALTVFAIPCIISLVYPLILTKFGTVAIKESYVAVLGFFLYGMTCIAIGTFISSLFESQILAAVISFLALFLGYMMSSICSLVSSSVNLLTAILGFYDLYTPMSAMMSGLFDIGSVVYYVSMTALFLFFTVQSIQKRRYCVSAKHFTFGAYSAAGIIIAIAIFVFANIGFSQIPETYTQIDCTYNSFYSITEQTQEYLKTINQDVTIYVLNEKDSYDEYMARMLEKYEDSSKYITVQYVDPNVSPRFYINYTSSAPTTGSLIVVSDKRSKVVDYNDVYAYEYSMNYTTYSYDKTCTGFDGEGQVTSAIDYVLADGMPQMYILEGHGETGLDSTYTDALSKANIGYQTINLMDYETVPDDAACLLINGPSSDFSSDDVDKVTAYLDKGGRVIVSLAINDNKMTNFNNLLGYMDITFQDGLLIENDANNYYYYREYEMPTIYSSTYTSGIYGGGYRLFAPSATGIILNSESEEVTYNTFLQSSSSAYLMVNYTTATSYDKTEDDIDGPFPIGVEATKSLTDEEGNTITPTMVVYASVYQFTEQADAMVSNANQKLFMNTVGAFMDKESNTSIPVKDYTLEYLTIDQSGIIKIVVIICGVLPFGILIAGIVIWAKRRRR